MNPPKGQPRSTRPSSTSRPSGTGGSSHRTTSSSVRSGVRSGTGSASRPVSGQAPRRSFSQQTTSSRPQQRTSSSGTRTTASHSAPRQTASRSSSSASQRTPQRKPPSPAERRRREQMRRRRAFRARAIAILVVSAVVLLILFIFVKPVSSETAESTASSVDASSLPSSEVVSESKPDPDALTPAKAQEILNDPLMILVNSQTPLANSAPPADLVEISTGMSLRSAAAAAFTSMQNAAAADGIDLQLKSGYRSLAYQTDLFQGVVQRYLQEGMNEEEAKIETAKTILPAGYSEHNSGLAICVNSTEYPERDESFALSPTYAWLTENATSYGFILRYPKGMESITGISYKPYHWRYVGVENAARIQKSGLCLEAYISMLNQTAAQNQSDSSTSM